MSEEDPVEELEEMAKKAKPRATARAKPTKKKPKKTTKKEAAAGAAPKPKKAVYKEMKVNFWRTRLHDEELGIHQQLKYQAKTRFFSKNFDIEGVVEINKEKKYIIAYSKESWEEKPEAEKRLVCRIFTIMEEKITDAHTAKGGNYKGSLELSFTHSLIQSYEIKHPAPVFIMQIPRTIYFNNIIKTTKKKRNRNDKTL